MLSGVRSRQRLKLKSYYREIMLYPNWVERCDMV